MRKLVIEIDDEKRQKNDIMIYDGSKYTTMSKEAFLYGLTTKLNKLSSELENALERIESLEKQLRIDHGEE